MVDAERRKRGWSQSKLAYRIGELPESGRYFDATGVRRLIAGSGVRVDRELVDRLVQLLSLDPFLAYELADLRPPGFSAEDHRRFQLVAAGASSGQPRRTMGTWGILAGQRHRVRLGARVPVRCTRPVTATA
jgi:hypothetical protein